MFQQLLNTTAIWLVCLLAYDLLLGRETYHRYNRIYLLGSLILGIILPVISWQTNTIVYHTPLSMPLQQVVSAKQSIETTVLPATPEFNTSLILLFVYLIGVAFSLAMIGREILLLLHLYAHGNRHKEGKWTVIETNQPHGPFSIFNCLFVGNKKLYDENEWNILLRHEREHISQRHFIDIVILQLARIIFWFHPLVYVFRSRILMIHEYQADAVGADRPSEYGAFLIEQAMLHTTPGITHSFNRSPIKKRIFMLTKRSSKHKTLKALVAIPVIICCMLCFTKNAHSFDKGEDNVVVFKGNKFEFDGPGGKDLQLKLNDRKGNESVRNNKTGEEVQISFQDKQGDNAEPTMVSFFAAPVKMNGEEIHSAGEVTREPVFKGKDKTFSHYLFNSAKSELDRLDDGEYFIHISYPVLDDNGSLVYYENKGITPSGLKTVINRSTKQAIDSKLTEALDNAPKFQPAEIKGKPVIWYDAWAMELGYYVIVKNHNATLQYRQPH